MVVMFPLEYFFFIGKSRANPGSLPKDTRIEESLLNPKSWTHQVCMLDMMLKSVFAILVFLFSFPAMAEMSLRDHSLVSGWSLEWPAWKFSCTVFFCHGVVACSLIWKIWKERKNACDVNMYTWCNSKRIACSEILLYTYSTAWLYPW